MVVILFMLFSLSISMAGYQGYIDDVHYLQAARGWLNQFPFLGFDHWHNRYPLVIPIAVSFALFKESDLSMTLPAIIAYIALVYSVHSLLSRITDKATAVVGACLASTLPLFAFYGGTPRPDIIEGGLVTSGLVLFLKTLLALDANARKHLFCAGILFGLAFGARQFALAALLFLGILYVFHPALPRRYYWLIAAGFSAIILSEIVYYWIVSGDPLYRYHVDLHPNYRFEDAADYLRDRVAAKVAFTQEPPFFNVHRISQWISNGPVHVHWIIDPYLDFLTDGNFGFLFWFAIPFAWWVCFARDSPNPAKQIARLLLLFSALWFFVVVYLLASRPHSRYYLPIAFSAVVIIMLGLRNWVWPKNHAAVIAIVAFLMSTNWLLLDLKPAPQYIALRFRDAVEASGETVYASPKILERADFYLRGNGLLSRAAPTPAPKGALVFVPLEDDNSVDGSKVLQWIQPAREGVAFMVLDAIRAPLPDGVRRLLKRPYPKIAIIRQP
jgi:4-amino-4-deoxy-L-arabinose transferase-like glycosyltransferase